MKKNLLKFSAIFTFFLFATSCNDGVIHKEVIKSDELSSVITPAQQQSINVITLSGRDAVKLAAPSVVNQKFFTNISATATAELNQQVLTLQSKDPFFKNPIYKGASVSNLRMEEVDLKPYEPLLHDLYDSLNKALAKYAVTLETVSGAKFDKAKVNTILKSQVTASQARLAVDPRIKADMKAVLTTVYSELNANSVQYIDLIISKYNKKNGSNLRTAGFFSSFFKVLGTIVVGTVVGAVVGAVVAYIPVGGAPWGVVAGAAIGAVGGFGTSLYKTIFEGKCGIYAPYTGKEYYNWGAC
jgi:F0F1-type ATP synthase assembly protein I